MLALPQVPQVDESRCTLCGLCVDACPCHAIELGERGPVFSCPSTCLGHCAWAEGGGCCCVCEEVCPTHAITWEFEIVSSK